MGAVIKLLQPVLTELAAVKSKKILCFRKLKFLVFRRHHLSRREKRLLCEQANWWTQGSCRFVLLIPTAVTLDPFLLPSQLPPSQGLFQPIPLSFVRLDRKQPWIWLLWTSTYAVCWLWGCSEKINWEIAEGCGFSSIKTVVWTSLVFEAACYHEVGGTFMPWKLLPLFYFGLKQPNKSNGSWWLPQVQFP